MGHAPRTEKHRVISVYYLGEIMEQEIITRKDLENCKIVVLCFEGLGRYPFDVPEIKDCKLTIGEKADGDTLPGVSGVITYEAKKKDSPLLYPTGENAYYYNFEPEVAFGTTLGKGLLPETIEIWDGKEDLILKVRKEDFKVIFE